MGTNFIVFFLSFILIYWYSGLDLKAKYFLTLCIYHENSHFSIFTHLIKTLSALAIFTLSVVNSFVYEIRDAVLQEMGIMIKIKSCNDFMKRGFAAQFGERLKFLSP